MYENKYLNKLSKELGFSHVDELEKVLRLKEILKLISEDNALLKQLVLKGGTAINLLWFDLPRLSIDIDLNYIGAIEKDKMEKARTTVIQPILENILKSLKYKIETKLEYANNTYELRYTNSNNGNGVIKLDINYLHRIPVLGVTEKKFKALGEESDFTVRTLTLEELYAGKLKALFDRNTPRDLFDVYMLVKNYANEIDEQKLKKAFIFLGTIGMADFDKLNAEKINRINQADFRNVLKPMLRNANEINLPEMLNYVKPFLEKMITFNKSEKLFINTFYDKQELVPEILFESKDFDFLKNYPAALSKLHSLKTVGKL
ncbi:MAG: nucleotidyl transferase AbiEii/AbiGii toxin family protein [Candidatus Melainabacteria bacterium]|nr:nucleotidyl transferase AbiEii/AbiGii toxin family protein [Candidatus Melainabacteria bacterium]